MEAFKLPLVLSSAVVLLFAGTLLAKTVVDAGRVEGIEPPRHYMPLLSFGATIAMCLVGAAFGLSVFGHASWWTGLLAVVAALVISPVIATVVGKMPLTPFMPIALSLLGLGLGIWWLKLSAFFQFINP
jgi:hypothetical protein